MQLCGFARVALLGVAAGLCGAAVAADDSARFVEAHDKWNALSARTYTYDLGVSIGAVFGYGHFHVKVKEGRCLARHYAGVGFGRPSFGDRLRYRPCDGYLPADLFQSVRDDLARGWKVTDLTTDDRYGFPSRASIDNDGTIEDQGWGFEITNFRLRQ